MDRQNSIQQQILPGQFQDSGCGGLPYFDQKSFVSDDFQEDFELFETKPNKRQRIDNQH